MILLNILAILFVLSVWSVVGNYLFISYLSARMSTTEVFLLCLFCGPFTWYVGIRFYLDDVFDKS